jgi:hypothetical protein
LITARRDAVMAMGARARACFRVSAELAALAAVVVGFAGAAQALPPPGTHSVTVACQNSVYGQMASGWRSPANGTLIAGPLAWPYLRDIATDSGAAFPHPASYAPYHGLAPSVKALVLVNAGTTVRVSIPANERTRLSLDYTYIPTLRAMNNGVYLRVADGASQVTFRACARGPGVGPTQFAGGIIVAGAQCARIDIYTSPSKRPLVRQIPFGVRGHICPASG